MKRIGLPAECRKDGWRFHASIPGTKRDLAYVIDKPSEAKARKALEAQVLERLTEWAELDANRQRRMIACGNGQIITISNEGRGWGYSISGPDRNYASACLVADGFKETIAKARDHANQCYDGISWECSL